MNSVFLTLSFIPRHFIETMKLSLRPSAPAAVGLRENPLRKGTGRRLLSNLSGVYRQQREGSEVERGYSSKCKNNSTASRANEKYSGSVIFFS